MLPRLRLHVSIPPGRDHLASVRRATTERYGEEWAELAAFADGAAVPFEDLALLNLRGDLGWTDGRMGCSDLAWRRDRSVIAHNEDGALPDVGRCGLLTLTGNGRPPVTAFWYPGFLPANAFAVTGDGLVWTIDHLPVASPGPGAGRHFVGRGLQRSARSADQVVGYLREHPSAGGFAYTVGDRAGRVVNVEAAAGHHAVAEAGTRLSRCCGTPTTAVTFPVPSRRPGGRARPAARRSSALAVPAQDPGPAWFLDVLTSPAAGRRPLRSRARRPGPDHAVHPGRRPHRGSGRDRRPRSEPRSRSPWPTWPRASARVPGKRIVTGITTRQHPEAWREDVPDAASSATRRWAPS